VSKAISLTGIVTLVLAAGLTSPVFAIDNDAIISNENGSFGLANPQIITTNAISPNGDWY